MNGQTVSVVHVARGPAGRVVMPGIPQRAWRPGAFPARRRSLRGISWRVVRAQQLLDGKEGFRSGTGRPPRPKDLASMARLRFLTGVGGARRLLPGRGTGDRHERG